MKLRIKSLATLVALALGSFVHGAGIEYDYATGNVNLVGGGITTLELKTAGLFTGAKGDFGHFGGLFDVYSADKAFKLDPGGFGDLAPFATLAAGIAAPAVEIDGAISGGGNVTEHPSGWTGLTVINGPGGGPAFCEGSTAQTCIDFNGAAPAGLVMNGSVEVRDMGGNNGGYLKVTDAANGERGSVIFPADLSPTGGRLVFAGRTGGANAAHHIDNIEINSDGANFTIAADLRVGGGTDRPADGFSFNVARPNDPVVANGDGTGFAASPNGEGDLPEEGTTTGLAIGFDEWESGGTDVVGFSVRLDNNIVAEIPLPTLNGALDDITSLQTGPNDAGLDNLGWAKLNIEVTGATAGTYDGATVRINWKGNDVYNETVPEPASLSLLGIGSLMGFGFIRRRRNS